MTGSTALYLFSSVYFSLENEKRILYGGAQSTLFWRNAQNKTLPSQQQVKTVEFYSDIPAFTSYSSFLLKAFCNGIISVTFATFNFCNDQGKVPERWLRSWYHNVEKPSLSPNLFLQKCIGWFYFCLNLHKHLSQRVSEDGRADMLLSCVRVYMENWLLPLAICNSIFVVFNRNMHVIHFSVVIYSNDSVCLAV